MKNTLLAAALTTILAATAHLSPAADSAAEQLATVTSAMNSIPDIIFYKDTDGVTAAATCLPGGYLRFLPPVSVGRFKRPVFAALRLAPLGCQSPDIIRV